MRVTCQCCFALLTISLCQAAAFRNLDFQSPNTQRISGSVDLVKYIIPGWSLQYGGVNQDSMWYNGISLLFPSAQLLGIQNKN